VAEEEPNGMLDLTSLLVTGRVSECLADFLGSAEQMSERVISHLCPEYFALIDCTGYSKMGVHDDRSIGKVARLFRKKSWTSLPASPLSSA
jgi:hypothetical protein